MDSCAGVWTFSAELTGRGQPAGLPEGSRWSPGRLSCVDLPGQCVRRLSSGRFPPLASWIFMRLILTLKLPPLKSQRYALRNLNASRSGGVGGNAGLNRRRRLQASQETWRRFPSFPFQRIEGRGEGSVLGFRGAKRINLSGSSPSVLLRDIPRLLLRQPSSHRHPNSLYPLQCPSPHCQDTFAPQFNPCNRCNGCNRCNPFFDEAMDGFDHGR